MFRIAVLTAVLSLGAVAAPAASAAASPARAAAAPAPSATPKVPLKEIGRVRAVSAFCSAFEQHFNGAVRPLLESDAQVSYIGFTLADIEPTFSERAGELRFYDDRVKMMRYLDTLQQQIPQAQAEIDDLRASAALARDPNSARDTLDLASQLQAALDKQHQIATDTLTVAQGMAEFQLDRRGSPRASTALQTNVPGGYDAFRQSAPVERRDIRSYLKWEKQLDKLGDAEGAAATIAGAIVERCR